MLYNKADDFESKICSVWPNLILNNFQTSDKYIPGALDARASRVL